MLPSFIKIIKVNEKRSGISAKSGKPYEMQDCECITLDDKGEMLQVGVLRLPRGMVGDAAPTIGTYTPVFAMQVGMMDRQIGPALVGLAAYPIKGAPVSAALKASA